MIFQVTIKLIRSTDFRTCEECLASSLLYSAHSLWLCLVASWAALGPVCVAIWGCRCFTFSASGSLHLTGVAGHKKKDVKGRRGKRVRKRRQQMAGGGRDLAASVETSIKRLTLQANWHFPLSADSAQWQRSGVERGRWSGWKSGSRKSWRGS